jgi:hypothetical protein
MLNQQLFFYRFPSAREESVRRISALMARIRKENPGLLLVMSPLPSYELTGASPLDPTLLQTLDRLPVPYAEGVRQEQTLYDRLRELTLEHGWAFVDNLSSLRKYEGTDRLYNDFDYHLTPAASAIIGRAQAAVVLETMPRRRPRSCETCE